MSRCSGRIRRVRRLSDEHGFTLMETLVALVIFVACYLLIHEGLSLGWRGVRLAQSETAALQVAQGQLAAAGFDTPLSDGQRSGETDGYAWTMDVRRQDRGSGAAASPLSAFWVTVAVSWRDRSERRPRSVQLTSMKLVVQP
jgi:prepilin-type N-terminal cleavage/methylation domain-containing protein